MPRRRILLVEDDAKTRAAVALYLERDGFEVIEAADGNAALARAAATDPALIVLDLMLPGVDGLQVCRRLRGAGSRAAIVMVTARTTEEDKLAGLDLGADDYITKPFSPRELMARIRAVLRRVEGEDVVDIAGVRLDRNARSVEVAGVPLTLTPTEFRILDALVRAPERCFTRQELVERAFGDEFDGLDRTVDVHVKNLRRKLGVHGESIRTVFGSGYKLTRS